MLAVLKYFEDGVAPLFGMILIWRDKLLQRFALFVHVPKAAPRNAHPQHAAAVFEDVGGVEHFLPVRFRPIEDPLLRPGIPTGQAVAILKHPEIILLRFFVV